MKLERTDANQSPQIIYIREEKESFLSKSLGTILGPSVIVIAGAGFLTGLVIGVAQDNQNPLITGLVGSAFAGAAATLGVKTIQTTADLGVSAATYAIMLPFRLPFIIYDAITYAQDLIKSANEQEELSSAQALAQNPKMV